MKHDYQLIFEHVLSTNEQHARFLNTLSLMELCGAKKLAHLVSTRQCETFLLEHVAEEFRHAYFLRKLATKIAGLELDYSYPQLFHARKAKRYIINLDRLVCLLLKQHALADPASIKERAYLLATFAIESRALPFYKAYQEALERKGIPISVKSIISEEESHLNFIKNELATNAALLELTNNVIAIETKLFNSWIII